MCGRFSQNGEEVTVPIAGERFRFQFQPNFNLAPSQRAGVSLAREGGLAGEAFRWGFLPPWSKDAKLAPINARVEGIFTNRMFRGAVGGRRCLVPASGWFEWQTVAGRKVPWRIVRRDGQPVFFAGIYSRAEPEKLGPLDTFALLTRAASPELSPVHDRMPVIVPDHELGEWLDPNAGQFRTILERPLTAGFEFYRVDSTMNSPSFNNPDCLRPVSDAA